MAEDNKTDVAAEERQQNRAENKRGRQDGRELDMPEDNQACSCRQGNKQSSKQGKRKRATGRMEGRKAVMGIKTPGKSSMK